MSGSSSNSDRRAREWLRLGDDTGGVVTGGLGLSGEPVKGPGPRFRLVSPKDRSLSLMGVSLLGPHVWKFVG
jgi:hypothetical protein